MAQSNHAKSYTQGHSNYTIATHLSRTAESDAAFLLPFLKQSDHILDVGCGPGTITTSLAKYASQGKTIGVDNSTSVLQKAEELAKETGVATQGPGCVVFEQGDILEGLTYPDESFDVVYCSQVIGHFNPPDMPIKALKEMRRVLKTGGLLATRDGMDSHFYPKSSELDRLWTRNARRAIYGDKEELDPTGTQMPSLLRSAGFDSNKITVGAGTKVFAGSEARKFLSWRAMGQLQKGDEFYQSWLDAGISDEEIQQTLTAVKNWAENEDAWFVTLMGEMLLRK